MAEEPEGRHAKAARIAEEMRKRHLGGALLSPEARAEAKRGSFDRFVEMAKARTGVDPMAADFKPLPCGLCGQEQELSPGGRIMHVCPELHKPPPPPKQEEPLHRPRRDRWGLNILDDDD